MNDSNNDREMRQYRVMITQLLNRQRRLERRQQSGTNNSNSNNSNNQQRIERYLESIEDFSRELEELARKDLEIQENLEEARLIGDRAAERQYREENKANKERQRQLEESIEHYEDMIEQLEEIHEDNQELAESLDNWSNNMLDMMDSFNLNQIADSLQGEAIDTKDIAREIANRTGQDIDTVLDAISESYKAQSKMYNNVFNSTEFAENLAPLIDLNIEQGVAQAMAGTISAFEKVTDMEISELSNIVTYGNEQTLAALLDMATGIRELPNVSNEVAEDILTSIDSAQSLFNSYYGGDQAKVTQANKEMMSFMAGMQSMGIDQNEQITSMITDVLGGMDYMTAQDTYGQAFTATGAYELMKQGKIEQALDAYYSKMIDDVNSGHSTKYTEGTYGAFYDPDLVTKIKSSNITGESYANSILTAQESMNASVEDATKVIQDNLPILTKWYNEFSSTGVGQMAERFFQNDMVESFGGFIKEAFMWTVGGKLIDGGKNWLLGKLGLGGTGGGTGGTGIWSTLKGWGSSAWNWGKNLFTGGGAGGTATATGGSATTATGAGGTGVWSTLKGWGSSALDWGKGVLGKANNWLSNLTGGGALVDFHQLGQDTAQSQLDYFESNPDKFAELSPEAQKAIIDSNNMLINQERPIVELWNAFKGWFSSEEEKPLPLTEEETANAVQTGMINAAQTGSLAQSQYDIFNTAPHYQGGISQIQRNGQPAILHKDEAVLTKHEAEEWRESQNAKNSLGLLTKINDVELLDKLWGTKEEYLEVIKQAAQSQAGTDSTTSGSATPGGPIDETLMYSGTEGFFQALGPSAKEGERQYGVFAAVTLAQAALESGWGKSNVAKTDKNLFGIKWTGKFAPGLNVTQGLNCPGREQGGARPYNRYQSFGDSMTDHAWFLKNNPRYTKHGAFSASNAKEQVRAIAAAGYAEDMSYATSLCNMIDKYNLTQYKQGTPFVPNDQIALLHKGEMVVPSQFNPNNSKSNPKSIESSDELLREFRAFVSTFKNAVTYLASKIPQENQTYTPVSKLKGDYHKNQLRRGD